MKSNYKLGRIPIFLILFLLVSCIGDEEFNKKLLPDHINSYSNDFIKLMNSKKMIEAKKRISRNEISKLTESDLEKAAIHMPEGEIKKIIPLDSMYYKYDEYIEYYTKYKIEYQDVSQIVLIGVIDEKEGPSVLKFEIVGQPTVLADELGSLKLRRTIFLILSSVYLLIILISVRLCLSSSMKAKWKILLTIFCFFGVAKFSFIWNSGEIASQVFSIGVTVPVFFYTALSGNSVLILSFYLPIGAIILLLRKKFIFKKFATEDPQRP